MGKIIAVIVAVIVIGGGGYLLLSKDSNDSSKQDDAGTSQPQSTSNNTTQNTDSNKPVAATIVYSDSGFSPKAVTVKVGDKISIKNASSKDMQFDSDPHPAHTDNEELNVGAVGPNQAMTFTVSRTGTFGYHDHLNPNATGTIVVQ